MVLNYYFGEYISKMYIKERQKINENREDYENSIYGRMKKAYSSNQSFVL